VKRQQYNASVTAKISSDARTANEAQAFAIANAATSANPANATSIAATSTVSNVGVSPSAAMNSTAPASQKYEAVDLRSSIQTRINEGQMLSSRVASSSLDDHAGVFVRFVAMLIDYSVLGLANLAFLWLFALFAFRLPEGAGLLFARLIGLLMLVFLVGYFVRGESGKHRATFGKRLMGLAVYRSDGKTPLSGLRAAVRVPLRLVSAGVLMLGCLIAFVTERKQTLHDLMTDTVVFRKDDPPASQWLYGLICIVVLSVVGYVGQQLVLNTMMSNYAGLREELRRDERIDPRRASPTRLEVANAYGAGQSMQRAISEHYAANKSWPTPDQKELMMERSGQSLSLRSLSPSLLSKGSFSLSLGATRRGTARLFFAQTGRSGVAQWECLQVNVAESAQIDECDSFP
jgi:uncharacterized RDD family membrane protein YckC